jgi:phage terminase large subunit
MALRNWFDDQGMPVKQDTATVNRIHKFYTFLKKTSRMCPVVCLYGGAGSGKSEAICQELIDRMINEEGIDILITRKAGPSLTASTYEMICRILGEYGYVEGKDYQLNKTERTIRFPNGNTMWFKALDDPEKIKSMNLNYVYIEEATEIDYKSYIQLTLRCRKRNKAKLANQTIISFNPVSPYHWTKTEIVDKADLKERTDYETGKTIIEKKRNVKPYIAVQHSTFLDNPFVNYGEKMDKLKEEDDSFYKMYALGEFVKLGNLIYKKWDTVKSMPWGVPPSAMGLDFGWNHPTVLTAVWHLGGDELFIKEIVYEKHITTKDLLELMEERIPKEWLGIPIYADSARPDQIEEMQREGWPVEPAMKDVKAGIDIVKRFLLHIDENSIGLLAEIPDYKWKEKDGRVLDEPVKINDDGMDAIRYAVFSSEIAQYATAKTFSNSSLNKLAEQIRPSPHFNEYDNPARVNSYGLQEQGFNFSGSFIPNMY